MALYVERCRNRFFTVLSKHQTNVRWTLYLNIDITFVVKMGTVQMRYTEVGVTEDSGFRRQIIRLTFSFSHLAAACLFLNLWKTSFRCKKKNAISTCFCQLIGKVKPDVPIVSGKTWKSSSKLCTSFLTSFIPSLF